MARKRKHIHVNKGKATQNINHRITVRHKHGCGGCLVQVISVFALIALGFAVVIYLLA